MTQEQFTKIVKFSNPKAEVDTFFEGSFCAIEIRRYPTSGLDKYRMNTWEELLPYFIEDDSVSS